MIIMMIIVVTARSLYHDFSTATKEQTVGMKTLRMSSLSLSLDPRVSNNLEIIHVWVMSMVKQHFLHYFPTSTTSRAASSFTIIILLLCSGTIIFLFRLLLFVLLLFTRLNLESLQALSLSHSNYEAVRHI